MKKIFLACGIVLLGAFVFQIWIGFAGELQCRKKLTSIFVATLKMYRNDHDQNYPDSLAILAEWFMNPIYDSEKKELSQDEELQHKASLIFGKCPCSKTHMGPFSSIDRWGDYVYVAWTNNGRDAHADYPLAYERSVSHHFRRGVNVILVDGTVFWDSNASFIRQFVEQHPSLGLCIPN